MIERLKNICDYISRGATPDYVDDSPYKVMNQATFSKGFIDETNLRYSSKNPYGAQIHKGDLLMASTGGGILGKVVYFDKDEKDFYADSHVSILRNSKGTNLMKFLYYYFLIRYDEINATMVKGSTNQTELQRNYLVNYELDIPSLPVQRRIVSYLDSKTSAIDHAISLMERKREAYTRLKASVINRAVTRGLNPDVKLKDSGVEWIGKIPEGWKVNTLKHECKKITDGSHFSPKTIYGKGMPYITVSNVYDGKIDIEGSEKISIDDFRVLANNGCQPKIGYVLLSKDGTVGRTAVVKENNFVVLSSLGILTPSKSLQSGYLKYLLDSKLLQSYMEMVMAGSALRRITIYKIENLPCLVPPLSEQRSIASYLDAECSKIDRAASIVEKQIDAYKRLKRSLINEVVTGKRKVD